MKGERSLAFVDTNILVYAFDRLEVEKHAAAAELIKTLWQTKSGCLSTQVLQEFHAAVTRPKKQGLSLKESQEIISSFAYWPIYAPKPNDILQAIDIQSQYKLSFWDAMIVQSAAASQCELLYSEDLSHGQVIAGVCVVNPFLKMVH
jgi:predicted nucleic acid-binding protein